MINKDSINLLLDSFYKTNVLDYLPRDKLIRKAQNWLKRSKKWKEHRENYIKETWKDPINNEYYLIALAIAQYMEIEKKPDTKYIIN